MFYFIKLKKDLADYLKVSEDELVITSDYKLGHLSLALFKIALEKNTNPNDLANEKAKQLESSKWNDYIEKIEVKGPYLNIFLKKDKNNKEIIRNILSLKNLYGNFPLSNYRVMVEHANQNTHKDLHIGHIRNMSYGDSIYRLLNAGGKKTIPVSYINDQGINVAKTIWYLKQKKDDYQNKKNRGELLGECYVKAVSELEKNKERKKEVEEIMKDIEKKQGENYQLWKESRLWSIEYFNKIYKELSIKLDRTFYESQMLDKGKTIVKDLLAKNIFKISDNAVIANLEEDGLGVMPILRSDSTALYPVADLALALTKFELYNLNESIYVIDVRQSLHFKQLFKILEKMGSKQKLTHLSYDFVKLKSGMMSSRSGNTVSYNKAFFEIFNKAKEETKKRHLDWCEKKINTVAKDLSLSTLKFEMLKVSQDKTIVFDIEESLRFDGYTAAYLQYSGARINSLLKKGLNIFDKISFSYETNNLKLDSEFKITLLLAQYPEKIRQASHDYNPSIICRYLFDLCLDFNDYYQSVNILKADKKTKKARLALVMSVLYVLKNGFNILGIKYLNEM